MKQQISKILSAFLVAFFALLMLINYIFQKSEAEHNQELAALSTISQIQEILTTNEADLETLTDSLVDEYMIRAKMVAYITQNVEIESPEEYLAFAELLGVDEIHVFNEDGVIYDGSEPSYWGYSFDSGEQMSFFTPLLEDKTLTLAQDITPNTAEEKLMMYIATWEEDGTDIVQIGLEPARILEAQSNNEMSYIFSNMLTTDHTTLFAIDQETGTILGSSEDWCTQLNCATIGLDLDDIEISGEYFYNMVNGVNSLCVVTAYEDIYIAVVVDSNAILTTTLESLIFIGISFLLAIIFCYFSLMKIIDLWVLRDMERLITQVSKITSGNLDTQVQVGSSAEFVKLCQHLNLMVSTLLNTTAKMSHVLDYVDTKIAVYEYKGDMERVFATRKIAELLDISQEELNHLTTDKGLFESKIRQLKTDPMGNDHIYMIEQEKKYLQIEALDVDEGECGIIIDVTDTVLEKQRLEYERDFDLLTELYNRRAFFREMDALFDNKETLKESVIIALDLDNLKEINDTYGHNGGDVALKATADVLQRVPSQSKILARVGGDEFLLVLYGEEYRSTLQSHLQNLDMAIRQTFLSLGNDVVPLQMSAGYIFCAKEQVNYNDLLMQADEALYVVKRNGKNQFLEYNGTL